jgi:hypothetical protein
MLKIRTGDRVEIGYENRVASGQVRLASTNGKNMMLVFPQTPPLGDILD